ESDRLAPPEDIEKLLEKLQAQKGITVTNQTCPGANHFFETGIDTLTASVEDYVRERTAALKARLTE
ncbi:MAG: alpha/beta hydrolase, partial [Pikeienuella sp.]